MTSNRTTWIMLSVLTIPTVHPASLVYGQATSRPSEVTASQKTADKAETRSELESIDLLTLDIPTVVTASRREQKITSVPYAITVITAEDIRAAGARTIPDALRLAPGMDVADLAVVDNAVNARGLQGILSREVLVLVDGRQIFDCLFGGTMWGAWPFLLEDIKQIEVIRGPGGVTWGANAANGVINIITKDPADQKGLTVTGGGGSRGWNKEHAGYAFQDKKLRLRVSGEYESSDGFKKGGSLLKPLDDYSKIARSGLHAIYDAGPNDTLTVSGGNATASGGFPQTFTGSPFGNTAVNSHASFLLGRWDHKITEDNRFYVNAYINDYYDHLYQQLDYQYQQFALQFGQTFKPTDNHTVTWGIDSRADYLDTSLADPFLLTQNYLGTGILGMYVQDEWRFAPKWRLNLGARIDYECYGGFQPSGRASLAYDLNDTSMIYGSVSRAFQMAPVGARFLNIPLAAGLAHVTSDQDVNSEELIAYELGYRGRFFESLNAGVALYCHNYENISILKMLPGPPGLMQNRFVDAYNAYFYGVELDAQYTVTPRLTLLGNYTFQNMDSSGYGTYGQSDCITPPKHKFMIGARYNPIDPLKLSAHLYYVDHVMAPNPTLPTEFTWLSIPQYFRLDLRAEYEFWKDRGTVAVGVRNLLDPHHPEGASAFMNYAEVPRMVYAELRMTFK